MNAPASPETSSPRQKCALIVDDSPTARYVLGQRLQKYDMRAEMAESAEIALEILTTSRPDVIFMDHMMPGMDGFEAIRAIKSNPATATIPVMMYTTQAGELYVGQARALGAVGVLPKKIKSAHLSEILESLHLLPRAAQGEADAAAATPAAAPASTRGAEQTSDVDRALTAADLYALHEQFDEILTVHDERLRGDIEAGVVRLLRDAGDEEPAAIIEPPLTAVQSGRGFTMPVFSIAAILVLAVAVGWLYVDSQRKWNLLQEQNAALLATLEQLRNAAVAEPERAVDETGPDQYAMALTGLEWSANQESLYDPAEPLLGDRTAEELEALVAELYVIGFSGVIGVNSYSGQFCYVYASNGALRLAPDELPVTSCDQVGLDAEEARKLAGIQSVAFANLVAAIEADPGTDIRVEVEAHGSAGAIAAYPAWSEETLAGEWNFAARQNNRVNYRLFADTTDLR